MKFLFSENIPNYGEKAKKESLSNLKVFLNGILFHSFQMNSGESLNGYFMQVSC